MKACVQQKYTHWLALLAYHLEDHLPLSKSIHFLFSQVLAFASLPLALIHLHHTLAHVSAGMTMILNQFHLSSQYEL